jgi:hypothetical protein
VHVAAFHPLTPGNPAYALVKVGAIGSLFAVRYAMTRRKRQPEEQVQEQEAPQPTAHPVSARKAKRRRKHRR